MHHGPRMLNEVVRQGVRKNGKIAYRCKLCLKESHAKHYLTHKEKVDKKHAVYRVEHRDKKIASQQRYYAIVKADPDKWKKAQDRRREWQRSHPDTENRRKRRQQQKNRETLSDLYVRKILTNHSQLYCRDMPREVVHLKRELIKLRRLIKEQKSNVKD